LLDVWFEPFKAWRLPHAPHAVRFVHTTVYRIYVRVLLIMPTVIFRFWLFSFGASAVAWRSELNAVNFVLLQCSSCLWCKTPHEDS
jgi:hypothetical protein